MSEHRRAGSRHRDAPGRHRPLARGGRTGILIAAIATTSAVAIGALIPYGGPGASNASPEPQKPSVPSATQASLVSGIESLLEPPADSSTGDEASAVTDLPPRSGHGRRVVFDMSDQRVWIVDPSDSVRTTYEVSGSKTDNLRPGRYRVYSRSRHAVGFDYHSTMEYFVRFAHGKNAAIGFHDIPVDHSGQLVQDYDELGSPQSAGCIRQRRSDARAMWRFAELDTPVVVKA